MLTPINTTMVQEPGPELEPLASQSPPIPHLSTADSHARCSLSAPAADPTVSTYRTSPAHPVPPPCPTTSSASTGADRRQDAVQKPCSRYLASRTAHRWTGDPKAVAEELLRAIASPDYRGDPQYRFHTERAALVRDFGSIGRLTK